MKVILILCFLLVNQINLKLSRKSEYDYTDYKAVEYNKDLKDQTVISSEVDESALYINDTNKVIVENSIIIKESGDSSKIENSEFFGVNAAILVQGGNFEMIGGEIITSARGGNAIFVTNDAQVTSQRYPNNFQYTFFCKRTTFYLWRKHFWRRSNY